MSPACALRRTIGLTAAGATVLTVLDACYAISTHQNLWLTYTAPKVDVALLIAWVLGDVLHRWANRPVKALKTKEGIHA